MFLKGSEGLNKKWTRRKNINAIAESESGWVGDLKSDQS